MFLQYNVDLFGCVGAVSRGPVWLCCCSITWTSLVVLLQYNVELIGCVAAV